MRAKCLELVLASLVLATPALAGDIEVSDAWIRALPAKLPAAGYFTLHNKSKSAVTLIGAETSACGMTMLHKSSDSGGMSHMEDVDTVVVPAGGTVEFAQGGYHLMCMDPAPTLKPGSKASVTLIFSDGAKVTSEFAVKNARGE